MSKQSIKVNEKFMIRRIDPVDMISRYLQGEYDDLEEPPQKIKTGNNFVSLGRNIGESPNDEIYKIRDKNNNKQIVVTTNQVIFKHISNPNNSETQHPIIKCKYCWCNLFSMFKICHQGRRKGCSY